MTKSRKISIILIIICISMMIFIKNATQSVEKKDGIDSFPDSYKPYLNELKRKHPNWKFTALYTNLDWNYVINSENEFGKNLVPLSYSDNWKNTKSGEYNIEVDSGWVDCSRNALEYCMDPRNFLNETRIFQFEALSYDNDTNNIEGIEKILYGTEFYNRIVQYVTSSGNTITMQSKYSDLILAAARTSNVSCYHLASRIKQEVGPFLSHSSISGTIAGYEGLYNFYNIGATSSPLPMGAIKNGLQYAKDGKGASESTRNKYLIPWNNKERAITGGAIFIGSSYINAMQDTIYLQKFQVVSNTGSLFSHQYMTNALAPFSESKSIYTAYSKNGMLDNSINFIIPIYNNMPEIPTSNPNIVASDFVSDNTKVYANVTTTLNVRTGPSTSYDILTSVNSKETMTRIAKGRQSGELWDKVKLSNGMVGYVFQGYLKEVQNPEIEQINISIDNPNIAKGKSTKLKVEILPEEVKHHEIQYMSSNEDVAVVDNDGNITGINSGVATITIKAKENNVSNSINIKVYTPVEDMQVNVEQLTLQVGDKFIIHPVITPSDADNKNVIYTSKNNDIVQVDNLGTITAIQEGSGIIIVKSEDGNIEKEVSITIVKRLQEDEVTFDESLHVSESEISGLDINSNTTENITKKITTNYTIKIYDYKNNLLNNDASVGTGCKIRLVDENDIIKMEYIVVLYGDINGDGKINSIDLLVLQRHILELEKLKGVFLRAGNINKNGRNPSSLDSLLIQRHILGLQIIKQ